MKLWLIIGGICLLLIGFIGGYTYENKKMSFHSIEIGKQDEGVKEQINFVKVLNGKSQDDFEKINNIMRMLMSENIENVKVNVNKPDLYMRLNSTSDGISYCLKDTRIWFTSDGGIIGHRNGESWDEVSYKKMTKDDVQYLKNVINEDGNYIKRIVD